MSILSCARNSCQNVMCDRYSTEYGYICDECFEELVRSGIYTNINKFMNTSKGINQAYEKGTRAYFNDVFKPHE